MKVIGLTGGFASGKSTVSDIIKKMGIPVICADELARNVVEPGKPAYQKIVSTFGESILNEDKSINRTKLGSLVFTSEKKRKSLNAIVHPEVVGKIKSQIDQLKKNGNKLVVLDVPLLFEEDLDRLCESVVLVYAPENVLIDRAIKRDPLNKKEIKDRLASQMSIEEKKKRADYVIDNSGSLENTREQVERLVEQIR